MFSTRFANNYTLDDLEEVFNNSYNKMIFSEEEMTKMAKVFNYANSIDISTYKQYNQFLIETRRTHKTQCYSKIKLFRLYRTLLERGDISENKNLEQFMKLKPPRGASGVNVVTIFTSGAQMGNGSENSIKTGGCPMDCHYCPFEKNDDGIPTQPRSYLSTEPGNMRATSNKHHPVGQTLARLYQLELMGHVSSLPNYPSKCELIISGGTFNFYPKDYIIWFTTCMYYACNIYYDCNKGGLDKMRPMETLLVEQSINERSSIRVIGLTIETRPDYVSLIDRKNPDRVDLSQISLFNLLGVTRVQIGIQHTDDAILKKVNRKCTDKENQRGIRVLKQNGFKTDIHLMLDLPGSSPEKDIEMIDRVINDPNYQAHQWKIYPTLVTPYTRIKKWYDSGEYVPYAEDSTNGPACQMVEVIIHALTRIPPYIRVNRVVRDVPHKSIDGGLRCSNLRQLIDDKMRREGLKSSCIRNREVKLRDFDSDNIKNKVRSYESSGGQEYFISYESKDESILYGFIRLRLNKNWEDVSEHLHNHALIQELHVYGSHTNVGKNLNKNTQHQGLGKKLLKQAEKIAYDNNFTKMAIISGVGVREYYEKRGYGLSDGYMKRTINHMDFMSNRIIDWSILIFAIMVVMSFVIIMDDNGQFNKVPANSTELFDTLGFMF